MFVSSLASGWGGSSRNSHAFELPKNVADYYYCMITFEARHYRDNLSWKLRDRSGFDHELPYLFQKGDIDRRLNVSKFTIIVYGSQSQSDYKYECSLKYWSKDLKMPIAKYYSITTVEIAPSEAYNEQPKARARKKGEQDWKSADAARVTFDSIETVHECQLYYQLLDGIEVSSPILEIKCLWDQFDIVKDCFIDYEELILRGKLSVSFDKKHLYNTSYTATLRHQDDICDSNTSNNETIVRPDVKDLRLTPGGNYEYKMTIEGLNVSYARTIHVPLIVSVDRILWTELFGDTDQVTFHRYNSTLGTFWTNFHEGESTYVQTGVENKYLTLYKNGTFHYKFHSQPFNPGEPDNLITFGGSFGISILACSNIKRIDLLKLFKSKTNPKPTVSLSPIDRMSFSPSMPEALKLPEIIRIIVYNTYNDIQSIAKESFYERLKKFRLVSKLWSQAIPPTITGTVTSNYVRVFGVDIARKLN